MIENISIYLQETTSYNNTSKNQEEDNNITVFEENLTTTDTDTASHLEEKLTQAESKQGWTGKITDFFKGIFGFGSAKLHTELKQFQEGTLSAETLEQHIKEYEQHQSSLTNGLGNLAAGGAGILAAGLIFGTAPFSIPIFLGSIAVGAIAGGISKFIVSFVGDELTNKISDDETLAQAGKEFISGAQVGAVASGTKCLGEFAQQKLYESSSAYLANPKHYRYGSEFFNKISSKVLPEAIGILFATTCDSLTDGYVYNNGQISQEDAENNFIQNLVPFGLGDVLYS